MEIAQHLNQVNKSPSLGERLRFVDIRTLTRLGYAQEFLFYANTVWEVVKITPSWSSPERSNVLFYFDLQNDEGVIISSIADEILIKI